MPKFYTFYIFYNMEQNVFFSNFNKIHFIGIGGVSMSGLAKYCLSKGFTVTGSDKAISNETRKLVSLGAKVFKGHKRQNAQGAELIVYSSAVAPSNPELSYAVKNGIPILKRSELLGQILSTYKRTVAVAGSHGKTTVTAMIAEIFIAAGYDPAVFLGGERKTFGNFRSGGTEFAVAEACEYKRNFLDIHPSVAVALNVDNDHVDTYKTIDETVAAFSAFVKNGFCIVNADDKNLRKAFNSCTVTFGVKNIAAYQAKYIRKTECRAFTVYAYGKKLGRITLKIAGEHNMYNALAAVTVANESGVPFGVVKDVLNAFDGVKRRNEYLGKFAGVKCFADYAHHPTEIRALLKEKTCRTLAVFQPHTYSRTEMLLKDFVSALKFADGVIVYKTYPAREKYSYCGDGRRISEKLAENYSGEIGYAGDFSSLKKKLSDIAVAFDKIVFIGAGDIYGLAKKLLKSER